MNTIILLNILKKGWQLGITLIEFLWKHKVLVAIILLITYIGVLKSDIRDLKVDKLELVAEHQEYVNSVKEQNMLNELKRKEQELEATNKQVEIERKYNEKITKLQNDIATVNSSNRSLSEQLTKAKSRISEAPIGEVRTYASTTTELLETCSARLEYYGTKAQEHREAEVRAVELYNNVVDILSKDILPNDIAEQ